MDAAIIVEQLSKRFQRWQPNRAMTLQEVFQRGIRLRPREQFWALSEVTFEVQPGRIVGIIGNNGAGKSTLLRLVAGVGRPTSGRIETHGRVGAILDLGVGFNPELTGRENVFISGVSSGLLRREVAERFDEIVAFSELEEFIDNPLRTYSTGMHVRLAFAVASHIEPEVLLIDEVLAVGDIAFQKKCMDRIFKFRESGCAGMIVSHAPEAIRQLCDEVIWLDHGRIVTQGPTDEVVAMYVEDSGAKPALEAGAEGGPPESLIGELERSGGT